MRRKYIARTLAGRTIEYESIEALNRAKRRRKDPVVDSWPETDPPPFGSSDAREWDAYRMRHGVAG